MLTGLSVIALSKLYSLNDPRVAQTNVKGDLIVSNSNRIMTRSRAKLGKFGHVCLVVQSAAKKGMQSPTNTPSSRHP